MKLTSKIALAAVAASLTGLMVTAPSFAAPPAAHAAKARAHGYRTDPRVVRVVRPAPVRVGVNVRALPTGHVTVRVGGSRYYYHGGVYYQPIRNGYVVVRAPIGARVATLPVGYVSFYVGPRRYYHVQGTYYIYQPRTKTYVVVAAPDGAIDAEDASDASFAEQASRNPVVVVFPANGQSDEQMGKDRYDCHLWAADESGFDPSATTGAGSDLKDIYRRGMEACLTAKGYSVG